MHSKRMLMVHPESRWVVMHLMIKMLRVRLLEVLMRHRAEEIVFLLLILLLLMRRREVLLLLLLLLLLLARRRRRARWCYCSSSATRRRERQLLHHIFFFISPLLFTSCIPKEGNKTQTLNCWASSFFFFFFFVFFCICVLIDIRRQSCQPSGRYFSAKREKKATRQREPRNASFLAHTPSRSIDALRGGLFFLSRKRAKRRKRYTARALTEEGETRGVRVCERANGIRFWSFKFSCKSSAFVYR